MQYHTFCAANSGNGFLSFFDSILDEKNKKVFYIKGGPGCGKSTLMKRIAAKAKDAELIFCSGDPDSLDGLILKNENTVMIDATAPHSHDPLYPAVSGNLIDLGIGWEPKKLDKEKIIPLFQEKGELYRKCYHLLKSAKEMQEGVFLPLKKELMTEKIIALGDKILKQNALWDKRSGSALPDKRFLSGITPDGRITQTDTFRLLGSQIIILEDRWLQSNFLLGYLKEQLDARRIYYIGGYHPLFGEPILQHLIIPEANLSIITKDGFFPIAIKSEEILRTISMQSLIRKEAIADHKNKLTFIKRLERDLLDLAEEHLAAAKELHLKIEKEYAQGYCFNKTEAIKINLMDYLFG